MQFNDDIQALRRGELDQEKLLGRLKSYLKRPTAEPAELRAALDDAREAKHLTQADYDLLTQCIVDETGSGRAAAGDDVPPEPDVDDDSMTRLATSLEGAGSDQSTVDIGSRLRDRFILDEVVGAGGMGTVYRGRDVLKIEAQDRNPYVAIKILNDSFKERPDAFIVLQREASRQQRLAHPNIATVYDFDRSGGVIYITMEYLDGVSLDHYIKHDVRPKGGLGFEEALPIIEGMCAALSHAHDRNIVHADFKPGNCFITGDGQLKVLDFGIARAMKDPARLGEETVFDPRSIGALTPAYASPEMLANTEDADPRDDIYALACVSYELLGGRHPFHRIPADQAKANNLKPERIKHLTRRQNDALARALAFERSERTATAQKFLEGLRAPSYAVSGFRVALAVGAVGLVLVAALVVPGLLERWEGEAVLQQIADGQVQEGLAEMRELSREQQFRVLQEARPDILDHLREDFAAVMAHPDAEVDFAAAQRLLAGGTELYPDSAALRELSDQLAQRRESYLSAMIQDFEQYLAPPYLLANPEGRDLPDLLDRLADVDPTNPLLEDSRIPGAYADSVETALAAEDVAGARRYLDAGLALAPQAGSLADLQDRVVEAEGRLVRQQEIAVLENELDQAVEGVASLTDLAGLVPTVSRLRELDADNAALARAGTALTERFAEARDRASRESRLPAVESYLESSGRAWQVLALPSMVEPVRARQAELQDRQAELVDRVRTALQAPDVVGPQGRSAAELIADLRAVDADDPRLAVLQSELVQVRRTRAQERVAQADWAEARRELAALDALSLAPDQRSVVAADFGRIDSAEQQAREQTAAAARVAEAQRQAELERQAEERQRLLEQQRQDRIGTAVAALDGALDGFDPDAATASLRRVLSRMNELAVLEADHPALIVARERLDTQAERAIRGRPQIGQQLELAEATRTLIGDRPWLADLTASLEAALTAQREAERKTAVAAATARLDEALAPVSALAGESERAAAAEALDALTRLLSTDSAELASARQDFVRAHLEAARSLIDGKRFSAAEGVLQAASGASSGRNSELEAAQASLVAAREQFRQQRTRQETQARIEALAQRFSLEVSSGQLTRARATLDEYRTLAPDTALARQEGAQRLADGYERIGRQRLEAGNTDGAAELVTSGLGLVPGHPGLEALRSDVDRQALSRDIARWFEGGAGESTGAIRQMTQRYRELDPGGYARRESAWATAAAGRLAGLRDDPEAYNRFLQEARSVLDDAGPLARLREIVPPPEARPAEPQLASTDLFGRWCTDDLEIEFERNRMVFTLDGGRANYPVRGYDVSGDRIQVNWDDRRLGPMVFEFGDFTADKDGMVQLRGRPADQESWQTYNRSFLRCG